MKDFLNNLLDTLSDVVRYLINFLPDSPFNTFYNYLQRQDTSVSRVIGILNYFFPISLIVQTMSLWLGAIAVYYAISVVMRWAKVIGG